MKAMAAKQPSQDSNRQHQGVVQALVLQNEFPSTDAIVLQRMSACPCDGGCPLCEGDMVIQPKLRIGEPGDRYEREADRVADEVMRMPEPKMQRQVDEEQEEEILQTKPLVGGMHSIQRAPALLAMQQTHSNRYMQQVAGIQAKLKIGQPEDMYEQEANRVAEQVMQMSEPRLQRQTGKEKEEETLQSKEIPSTVPKVTPYIESRIHTLKEGGQPLSESVRAFFEPRFGADFSGVRVHADSNASRLAKSVHAKAFTVGKDVVFGIGQYAPNTRDGQRLLAHELAHTLQQSAHGIALNCSGLMDIATLLLLFSLGGCESNEVSTATVEANVALARASSRAIAAWQEWPNGESEVRCAYQKFFPAQFYQSRDQFHAITLRIQRVARHSVTAIPTLEVPIPSEVPSEPEDLQGLILSAIRTRTPPLFNYPTDNPTTFVLLPRWYDEQDLRVTRLIHEAFHFVFPGFIRHTERREPREPPHQDAFAYQGFVSELANVTLGPIVHNRYPSTQCRLWR